jgi:hypothetical protein
MGKTQAMRNGSVILGTGVPLPLQPFKKASVCQNTRKQRALAYHLLVWITYVPIFMTSECL